MSLTDAEYNDARGRVIRILSGLSKEDLSFLNRVIGEFRHDYYEDADYTRSILDHVADLRRKAQHLASLKAALYTLKNA